MPTKNGRVTRQENQKSAEGYLPCILVSLVYLLAGTRFFLLISRHSVNLLAWDQWDFDDATLFQHHSLWEMFRWQHGPHRQGLGALLQILIDPPIRWNSHYETLAIAAIVFAAAVLGLLLKARLFGSIGYTDIMIPLLFLTPLQYETLVAAPNPTQGPLPLLLAVLYCFCWLIRGYPRKYICVLLANFLLTYTGYAFFFGFITPVLLALDYRRNSRHPASKYRWWSAAAFAISLASLASFFVGYKLDPGFGCFSLVPKNPAGYLQFMAIMFAHVGGFRISNLTFAMLVGLIVLLSLVSGISLSVRRLWASGSETYPRDAAIVALLAYTAIFCLSTAYGRLCLGVQYGTTSRYTEWLALGFLGLYFFALSLRSRTWRASLTLVLLLLSLHGAKRLNRIDAGGLEAISNGKRAWRECYLARHSIQECTTLTHFQIFFPETARRQEKLDFLERNRLNLYDGSQ